MRRFVLRSLGGLGPIVAAETLLRFGHKASQIGPRAPAVDVSEDRARETAPPLRQLATADDAFLELASAEPVSRTKAGLTEIADLVQGTDAGAGSRLVLGWRGSPPAAELWITASVLGGRR